MITITIRIDEKIMKSFKMYVLKKYGKIKGVLGNEIESAMKIYLQQQGGQ